MLNLLEIVLWKFLKAFTSNLLILTFLSSHSDFFCQKNSWRQKRGEKVKVERNFWNILFDVICAHLLIESSWGHFEVDIPSPGGDLNLIDITVSDKEIPHRPDTLKRLVRNFLRCVCRNANQCIAFSTEVLVWKKVLWTEWCTGGCDLLTISLSHSEWQQTVPWRAGFSAVTVWARWGQ